MILLEICEFLGVIYLYFVYSFSYRFFFVYFSYTHLYPIDFYLNKDNQRFI